MSISAIYCEACIGCKTEWSDGSSNSCHEHCYEYQQWKNPQKTVYLGGAIDKVSPEFATVWRGAAKKFLVDHEFLVLDPTEAKNLSHPNINTSMYTPEQIVTADLDMIRRSNIVLAEISRKDIPYHGTSCELVYAYQWGKEIIVWGDCHSYWIRYHASKIFPELEKALWYIVRGGQ